jgi:hypothetical protein
MWNLIDNCYKRLYAGFFCAYNNLTLSFLHSKLLLFTTYYSVSGGDIVVVIVW